MSTPLYNNQQRVFALNFFSNLASSKYGTEAELQAELNLRLRAMLSNQSVVDRIGTWAIVWGPVVYQSPEEKLKVATNAMYVAFNQESNQYVVAIAGTNPISTYGWFTEDFDVRTSVPWPYATPTGYSPRISNGTSIGVGILLNTMKSNGAGLQAFLTSTLAQAKSPAEVIVTGHSLGGALSASVALALFNLQGQWDPGHLATVSALPSAGATPGNADFSRYFGDSLGLRTIRVWNRLDVVPHAWQLDMLETVPSLYWPYLVAGSLVQAFVGLAVASSLAGSGGPFSGDRYLQLLPQTPGLAGQVNITATYVPASEVFQFTIDLIVKGLLKKLGVPPFIEDALVAVLNLVLARIDTTSTLEEILEWLELELEKIPLIGKYIPEIIRLMSLILKLLSELYVFLVQLGYQHVEAYFELEGIPDLPPLMKSINPENAKALDFIPALPQIEERLLTNLNRVLTEEFKQATGLVLRV